MRLLKQSSRKLTYCLLQHQIYIIMSSNPTKLPTFTKVCYARVTVKLHMALSWLTMCLGLSFGVQTIEEYVAAREGSAEKRYEARPQQRRIVQVCWLHRPKACRNR